MMHRWNTQKVDAEKPLIPSSQNLRAHKLRFLQKTRRAVLFSGIAALSTWAVIGYLTDWTGGNLQALLSARLQRCHGSFRAGLKDKGEEFTWESVTPTEDLVYHPCWNGLECARLEVPLDWEHPENGLKAGVAIVKVPAQVDESSEEWGGPVLINPGGPGGSGVSFGLSRGREIQTILGPQFSILGFDPRGINNTTPSMSCFHTAVSRKVWGLKSDDRVLGSSGSGEEISEAYSRAKVVGEICENALGGEGLAGVGKHVGTAVVARDMLEITERAWKRVGKGREEVRGKGLRYWGFSYGSVLGITFASMFPERVDRLAIDGICDVEDYYKTGWTTNLQDAEKVMDSFHTYCSAAGPLLCGFHTGTTPEHISFRLSTLIAALKRQPLPVSDAPTGAEIITYSDVKSMLFRALYKPLYSFPKVAKILADLEKGDGKSMVTFTKEGFQCNCDLNPVPEVYLGSEAIWSIACSDGEEVDDTLESFGSYLSMLRGQSETSGGTWAKIRMGCVGWKVRPAGLKYNGPFTGNTSWPLLIIGNSADPVTPVRNAHKMAKGYKGAVVLEQNSEGHCSISTPSLCTAKYIREYFQAGVLPPRDTVCDADLKPFFGGDKTMRVMSEDDKVLFEAVSTMGREWTIPMFGH